MFWAVCSRCYDLWRRLEYDLYFYVESKPYEFSPSHITVKLGRQIYPYNSLNKWPNHKSLLINNHFPKIYYHWIPSSIRGRTVKSLSMIDMYQGRRVHKKGFQAKSNILRDENGDVVAWIDGWNTLVSSWRTGYRRRWGTESDVLEVEIAIDKLKIYKRQVQMKSQ